MNYFGFDFTERGIFVRIRYCIQTLEYILCIFCKDLGYSSQYIKLWVMLVKKTTILFTHLTIKIHQMPITYSARVCLWKNEKKEKRERVREYWAILHASGTLKIHSSRTSFVSDCSVQFCALLPLAIFTVYYPSMPICEKLTVWFGSSYRPRDASLSLTLSSSFVLFLSHTQWKSNECQCYVQIEEKKTFYFISFCYC